MNSQPTTFNLYPDVVSLILQNISRKRLLRLQRVSKQFLQIIKTEKFWISKSHKRYKVAYRPIESKNPDGVYIYTRYRKTGKIVPGMEIFLPFDLCIISALGSLDDIELIYPNQEKASFIPTIKKQKYKSHEKSLYILYSYKFYDILYYSYILAQKREKGNYGNIYNMLLSVRKDSIDISLANFNISSKNPYIERMVEIFVEEACRINFNKNKNIMGQLSRLSVTSRFPINRRMADALSFLSTVYTSESSGKSVECA